MGPPRVRLLGGLALAVAGAAATPAGPACAQEAESPAAALAKAVDLETPKARREAALELAKRDDGSVDQWLGIMRAFGTFEDRLTGHYKDTAPLLVEDRLTPTKIHWYVPEGYDAAKPAPLLVAFHGAGSPGRHEPARWQDTADSLGMLVVAPTDAGANDGYRFSPKEREEAMAAIRWIRRRLNVDENRIFLTGISRGGHLSWDLALRYPDRFAAIVPMVGGPRWNIAGGQNNMRYLENLVDMPIRDLQGLKDDAGMIFNLKLAFEKLRKWKARDAEFIEFPELGHSVEFDAVDWTEFFGGAVRDPAAARVVRACARLDQARSRWVEAVRFDSGVAEVFQPKLDARRWNSADQAGKKRMMVAAAEKKTARIEAVRTGPGQFRIKAKGVKRARLLLAAGMYDPEKPVTGKWNTKTFRKAAVRDRKVLLQEFVERFDRTFLPDVSVTVP